MEQPTITNTNVNENLKEICVIPKKLLIIEEDEIDTNMVNKNLNEEIFVIPKKKLLIIEEDESDIDASKNLNEAGMNYWEDLYKRKYCGNKYAKNTKNFSKIIYGKKVENPNIYIIPRERGGPSYKDVELEYDDPKNIQFCPISKGYSMQDVSSFTLGPVVGHGLNVVNSAFSKCIAIKHIDGSGLFTETNKKFWKKNRKEPIRNIINISDDKMKVDGIIVDKIDWLENNKNLWYENWRKWHDKIRLSENGNFNWCHDSETIIFCNCNDDPNENKYMKFVSWKKDCYIKPAYELFEKNNRVIEFLKLLYHKEKISIGLVHPKGKSCYAEKAITPEFIKGLYDSPYEMCCMPYVVAGYLLGVNIYA
jgi:hypothetical protein